jgi:DNA-binding PadR family transcriptional regulator
MSAARNPESHLPLSVPVHQILLSLADEDRHGYAIIQDIRARTGGEVELTASTLYGALSRMLTTGTIEEVMDGLAADGDGRRRYYRMTAHGRAVAREEAERLARTLDQARAQGLGPDRDPTLEGGTR